MITILNPRPSLCMTFFENFFVFHIYRYGGDKAFWVHSPTVRLSSSSGGVEGGGRGVSWATTRKLLGSRLGLKRHMHNKHSTVRLYLKKMTSLSMDDTSCRRPPPLTDCQLHLSFFIFSILWTNRVQNYSYAILKGCDNRRKNHLKHLLDVTSLVLLGVNEAYSV